MGGAPAPAPMGGASDVPPGDPGMGGGPMGGDPSMGGGDPMGGDPGMGGGPMDGGAPMGDPGMGGDPSMGGPNDGQLNPDMGGDPMGGDPMGGGEEGGDDSTMALFNQLSDDDKEAARGYIESMLSRDEDKGGAPEDDGTGGPNAGGAPMMESWRRRSINENLPVTDFHNNRERNNTDRKKGNNVSRKSPFNSPKFK